MYNNLWLIILSHIVNTIGCTAAGVLIGLLLRPLFDNYSVYFAVSKNNNVIDNKLKNKDDEKINPTDIWDNI